jgi:hypothetical protein
MIPRKKIDAKKQEVIDSCANCGGTVCGECGAKAARIERYAYSNIPVEYWGKSFKEFSGDANFKKIIAKKIQAIIRLVLRICAKDEISKSIANNIVL